MCAISFETPHLTIINGCIVRLDELLHQKLYELVGDCNCMLLMFEI